MQTVRSRVATNIGQPRRRAARMVLAWLGLLALVQAGATPPEPTERERELLETLQQPNAWFIENLKGPPDTADGQTLHPKIQWYQENYARRPEVDAETKKKELAARIDSMRDPQKRADMRKQVDRTWNFRTKITAEMAKVEERKIDGPGGPLAARVYTPKSRSRGPLPGIVYLHGGGWLIGSNDAIDRAARLLANEAQVVVVAVDYRLAPEVQFPAPQDDALAAFVSVRKNARSFGIDPARLGIGGDSAGGAMSVVTSLRLIEAGEAPPAVQLMYYPAADMGTDYRSYELFGQGFGLDRDFASSVFALFFAKDEDRYHPYASPLRAKSFKGMPPSIVAVAGFDILRDSGRLLAQKLMDDGVPVTYRLYSSLNHGFMQHSGTIDDAERACVETARWYGQMIRNGAGTGTE